ncbi:hypothetical protein CS0771_44450 [Catellatospora sp. IY07-71]|uniref:class I SAM-dependent methyltransferase n=1 Tax=Catellatospora sp. IY07-71 TaxID=2728827 RepID=UPI001BB2FCAD|nr:methyltransferase domain-containing protein [Catellatospora sp. IY07-71]BCJ74901.1 hypothetical protein CS0771_44450 [Catellatospora sp. IY07-71]
MPQLSGTAEHWQAVYDRNDPQNVSWYQPTPAMSLRLLEAGGARPGSSVLDAGGGASTLVDELLVRGMTDVTVLDLSEAALAAARRRLGERAMAAHWMARDLLTWSPLRRYDFWHDRAVFHFLTDPADRDRYRRVLAAALAPRGQAVIGTFAEDGPDSCSGLPVARYGMQALAEQFPGFQLLQAEQEQHRTPSGGWQSFTWVRLTRPAGEPVPSYAPAAAPAPAPAPQPGSYY